MENTFIPANSAQSSPGNLWFFQNITQAKPKAQEISRIFHSKLIVPKIRVEYDDSDSEFDLEQESELEFEGEDEKERENTLKSRDQNQSHTLECQNEHKEIKKEFKSQVNFNDANSSKNTSTNPPSSNLTIEMHTVELNENVENRETECEPSEKNSSRVTKIMINENYSKMKNCNKSHKNDLKNTKNFSKPGPEINQNFCQNINGNRNVSFLPPFLCTPSVFQVIPRENQNQNSNQRSTENSSTSDDDESRVVSVSVNVEYKIFKGNLIVAKSVEKIYIIPPCFVRLRRVPRISTQLPESEKVGARDFEPVDEIPKPNPNSNPSSRTSSVDANIDADADENDNDNHHDNESDQDYFFCSSSASTIESSEDSQDAQHLNSQSQRRIQSDDHKELEKPSQINQTGPESRKKKFPSFDTVLDFGSEFDLDVHAEDDDLNPHPQSQPELELNSSTSRKSQVEPEKVPNSNFSVQTSHILKTPRKRTHNMSDILGLDPDPEPDVDLNSDFSSSQNTQKNDQLSKESEKDPDTQLKNTNNCTNDNENKSENENNTSINSIWSQMPAKIKIGAKSAETLKSIRRLLLHNNTDADVDELNGVNQIPAEKEIYSSCTTPINDHRQNKRRRICSEEQEQQDKNPLITSNSQSTDQRKSNQNFRINNKSDSNFSSSSLSVVIGTPGSLVDEIEKQLENSSQHFNGVANHNANNNDFPASVWTENSRSQNQPEIFSVSKILTRGNSQNLRLQDEENISTESNAPSTSNKTNCVSSLSQTSKNQLDSSTLKSLSQVKKRTLSKITGRGGLKRGILSKLRAREEVRSRFIPFSSSSSSNSNSSQNSESCKRINSTTSLRQRLNLSLKKPEIFIPKPNPKAGIGPGNSTAMTMTMTRSNNSQELRATAAATTGTVGKSGRFAEYVAMAHKRKQIQESASSRLQPQGNSNENAHDIGGKIPMKMREVGKNFVRENDNLKCGNEQSSASLSKKSGPLFTPEIIRSLRHSVMHKSKPFEPPGNSMPIISNVQSQQNYPNYLQPNSNPNANQEKKMIVDSHGVENPCRNANAPTTLNERFSIQLLQNSMCDEKNQMQIHSQTEQVQNGTDHSEVNGQGHNQGQLLPMNELQQTFLALARQKPESSGYGIHHDNQRLHQGHHQGHYQGQIQGHSRRNSPIMNPHLNSNPNRHVPFSDPNLPPQRPEENPGRPSNGNKTAFNVIDLARSSHSNLNDESRHRFLAPENNINKRVQDSGAEVLVTQKNQQRPALRSLFDIDTSDVFISKDSSASCDRTDIHPNLPDNKNAQSGYGMPPYAHSKYPPNPFYPGPTDPSKLYHQHLALQAAYNTNHAAATSRRAEEQAQKLRQHSAANFNINDPLTWPMSMAMPFVANQTSGYGLGHSYPMVTAPSKYSLTNQLCGGGVLNVLPPKTSTVSECSQTILHNQQQQQQLMAAHISSHQHSPLPIGHVTSAPSLWPLPPPLLNNPLMNYHYQMANRVGQMSLPLGPMYGTIPGHNPGQVQGQVNAKLSTTTREPTSSEPITAPVLRRRPGRPAKNPEKIGTAGKNQRKTSTVSKLLKEAEAYKAVFSSPGNKRPPNSAKIISDQNSRKDVIGPENPQNYQMMSGSGNLNSNQNLSSSLLSRHDPKSYLGQNQGQGQSSGHHCMSTVVPNLNSNPHKLPDMPDFWGSSLNLTQNSQVQRSTQGPIRKTLEQNMPRLSDDSESDGETSNNKNSRKSPHQKKAQTGDLRISSNQTQASNPNQVATLHPKSHNKNKLTQPSSTKKSSGIVRRKERRKDYIRSIFSDMSTSDSSAPSSPTPILNDNENDGNQDVHLNVDGEDNEEDSNNEPDKRLENGDVNSTEIENNEKRTSSTSEEGDEGNSPNSENSELDPEFFSISQEDRSFIDRQLDEFEFSQNPVRCRPWSSHHL